MNYGAREYLWLWSESWQRMWEWPAVLHQSTYCPYTDTWRSQSFRLKVNREAEESVRILLSHGFLQEQIHMELERIFGYWQRAEEASRPLPYPDIHVAVGPEAVDEVLADEDRCPHGMFYSGAGACPQCGGGAE